MMPPSFTVSTGMIFLSGSTVWILSNSSSHTSQRRTAISTSSILPETLEEPSCMVRVSTSFLFSGLKSFSISPSFNAAFRFRHTVPWIVTASSNGAVTYRCAILVDFTPMTSSKFSALTPAASQSVSMTVVPVPLLSSFMECPVSQESAVSHFF